MTTQPTDHAVHLLQDLSAKARTYGMPADSVDGMDVLAVIWPIG